MKKAIAFIAAFSLFVSSCISYSAATTGSFGGALLGSAIGGIIGGPRGHDIGTVVGSLGGLAVGVGVDMARQRKMMEQQNFVGKDQPVVYTPISIRNLQLIDDNGDDSFNRGETCKLTFELRNNSTEKVGDIQLQLAELTKNKHLAFSAFPLIESMNPKQLLRITTYIKADNRLKDGTAEFAISASIEGEAPIDLIEFTVETRK